jgi:hypothetical protein
VVEERCFKQRVGCRFSRTGWLRASVSAARSLQRRSPHCVTLVLFWVVPTGLAFRNLHLNFGFNQ